ncbi:MAG: MBL fold metallo-hydrolase [Ruminococcus sp.]|nr:MBL fold metallo-hydrolase [Ruminococcus sp.]
MKITALAENTSCLSSIGCEHGLSLYIEAVGHRILFDMGQTDLFAKNAEKLDVDLSAVDIAVLSHGHYDHGGGLETFLSVNAAAPVYLHSNAFEPHFNGTEKYIGLNPALQNNNRLYFTGEEQVIADGVTLYACNTKQKYEDFGSGNLSVLRHHKLLPDDFVHEQYLLIEENGKRILVSGCSHKGILNILEWFRPDYLIGGFHFMKLECSDRLKAYAGRMAAYDTVYYTCHCTGKEQYAFMKPFVERLHYLSAGQTVYI